MDTEEAFAQLAGKIARMEELTRKHFGTESHPWYNIIEISEAYEHAKAAFEAYRNGIVAAANGRNYQREVDLLKLQIQRLQGNEP